MRAPFKRAWVGQVLSEEERTRQGAVVKAATSALGSVEARFFLNRHHSGLRGRPLDLAIASEDGLEAVENAIRIAAKRAAERAT